MARHKPILLATRQASAVAIVGLQLLSMPAAAQETLPTFTLTDDSALALDATAATPVGADQTGVTAPLATGSVGQPVVDTEDGFAIDDGYGPENPREPTIDGLGLRTDPSRNDATGIRLGSFTLKPSLAQTINHEATRFGGTRTRRTFLETGLKGTLVSDWSRHQLSIVGDGTWQRNISGEGETEPRASVDAALRLDLGNDITGTLRAGYDFEREDSTDPNAIEAATVQSGIHTISAGAGLARDFGLIRGSVDADLSRAIYGDAELANGASLSLSDRNRNTGTLRARIGYEISPALVPFLEASGARSLYDEERDSLGYERSYTSYGAKGGVEVDLGEKLRGEVALGYQTVSFDDSRLSSLSGLTLDSSVNWSPRRGTNVDLSLATTIEPSTTAGESGALAYTLRGGLSHELRSALVARLSSGFTIRDYASGSASLDENVWNAGIGLTWDINRWLALTTDASYERTMPSSGSATEVARIGIGLTLRR